MSTSTMSAPTAAAPTGLSKVKHIILVLSGKGGVGKSTVCCQLAMYLAMQPFLSADSNNSSSSSIKPVRVGIIDADLCGPSVTRICGADGIPVMQAPGIGWKPVTVPLVKSDFSSSSSSASNSDGAKTGGGTPSQQLLQQQQQQPEVHIMSMASLLNNDKEAVVWRGPRKDGMIKQFISGVDWGELDYLFIDTPPGTSDEHLTLCEVLAPLRPAGAIVVTTPQGASTDDVKKELHFLAKLKMRCLGIVENMSGFVCPHCSTETDIFSSGGGERLAEKYDTMFLGKVPIDPVLSYAEDLGVALWNSFGGGSNNNAAQKEEEGSALDGKAAAAYSSSSLSSPSAVALVIVIGNVMKQLHRLEQLRRDEEAKVAQ